MSDLLWLSPIQIKIVPVSDRHNDAAEMVLKKMLNAGLHAAIEHVHGGTLNARLRMIHEQKIPYAAIVGDREVADGHVSVRCRGGEQRNGLPIDQFIQEASTIYREKSLNL